ncbi:hypothetical protein BpHYR1_040708, partial [Brachionus plicatilis]
KGSEAKPRMCDQEIKYVDKLRYLGVILNRNNNNKDQNLQIDNNFLQIRIKIHLYKVFLRPTLTYGLENYVLSREQLKKIQTTEATMIKKMLNLKKTSRTTNLLLALGLEKIENKLLKEKLAFVKRLLSNKLSFGLFREIENNLIKKEEFSNKSIIKEILECLEEDKIEVHKIIQLIELKRKDLMKKETNGISDSIEECLRKMGNETYKRMLTP